MKSRTLSRRIGIPTGSGDKVGGRMMKTRAAYRLSFGAALLLLVLAACGGPDTATPGSDQAATVTPGPGQTPAATPSPGQTGIPLTPSANEAPRVGATAEVTDAAILQLQGSVQDDALPVERLTVEWTKISGPGPVEFANPSAVDTTAAFTVPGAYVLRLTASDGQFTVSDDVTVVVQP